MDQVNRISQRFQEGIKAFSDSPIIGEVKRVVLANKHIYEIEATLVLQQF